jgi:hypothetical protein
LQRLLRDDIAALADDLLVIAEDFGEWEDARRRIDLLALDKTGRLVVIELKRTDDGGHMELQALRYAAMVSSMGFAEVATTYAAHCAKLRTEEEVDSRAELLAFLDMEDADDEDPVISSDVRIMLVSADFGREITTTVLWLNPIRQHGHPLRPLIQPVFGPLYTDLAAMEDLLRDGSLDWTAIRPPRLTNGPLTGTYRTAIDRNVRHGLTISRRDVAHLMLLTVLQQPETVRHSVGVAY